MEILSLPWTRREVRAWRALLERPLPSLWNLFPMCKAVGNSRFSCLSDAFAAALIRSTRSFSLYFKLALKFNFLNESIYFALTPNKVIFSLSAIFISKSCFLNIGNPSKRTIEALEDKTEISQFHIIHPQVVK